ncbi:YbaB/EbfC family nucleoid-associated protein [Micromonospora sp. NBC_01655]|uniref:YbaB/EbfC family nucleoid-associated protein n=1 Tax=Micromonospora sp. NBC_01655 TaxID=2975983 RepID=UPI0022594FCB|nr:YbaB/EbfC family nucleoid-associated protein [Micromonospora sp. NBC_01655]MCX4472963.1 YbaB/EbfC family nucleoid-associated protein [Micromonospora sp. NBC_01655]
MSMLGDEELLAEMRAALKDVEEATDRVRRRVARAQTTVEDKKKLLSVTVGGHGELTRITFNGDAYRRLAPAELADLIVTTTRTAREKAQRKTMAGTAELTRHLSGLDDAAQSAASIEELVEGIASMVSRGADRRTGSAAS